MKSVEVKVTLEWPDETKPPSVRLNITPSETTKMHIYKLDIRDLVASITDAVVFESASASAANPASIPAPQAE